jgi:hypothetical protein
LSRLENTTRAVTVVPINSPVIVLNWFNSRLTDSRLLAKLRWISEINKKAGVAGLREGNWLLIDAQNTISL